jgi:hypothetical protein
MTTTADPRAKIGRAAILAKEGRCDRRARALVAGNGCARSLVGVQVMPPMIGMMERLLSSRPSLVAKSLAIAAGDFAVAWMLLVLRDAFGFNRLDGTGKAIARNEFLNPGVFVFVHVVGPAVETLAIVVLHLLLRRLFGLWPFVLVVVCLASVAHYYDGRAFVPVIAAGFFIYSWQYDLWRRERGGILATVALWYRTAATIS